MHDIALNFGQNVDGVFAHKSQMLPSEFLASLKESYDASATKPMGDMHHVAAVPVIVVERWRTEGFDIYSPGVTPREIVRRLRAEHLDGFITSKNRV